MTDDFSYLILDTKYLKIVAHKIINIDQAENAVAAGIDFLEVDVAKRIIFSKFTTQHNAIAGKLGLGKPIEPLLSNGFTKKLYLDIKQASYSLTFVDRFCELLKRYNIKNIRICGRDWQIISKICLKNNLLPFYTIDRKEDLKELITLLPKLFKPAGFSVRHSLINKYLIDYLKSIYPKSEIWAWTVNNSSEAKRLIVLGVDGIISDEWEKILKSDSNF